MTMHKSNAVFFARKPALASMAIICFILTACQRYQGSEPAKQATKTNPDVQAPANNVQVASATDVVSKSDSMGKIAFVKKIDGAPSAILSVGYLDRKDGNPTCTLQISEAGKVVAENSNMVECGLVLSPDMLDVEVTGNANDLTVFQQKTRQTNTYSLRRIDAGRWVVTKAEFVYPQDNMKTGEVDVIRETADLIRSRPPIMVSRYERGLIAGSLVKSVVQ